MMFSFSVFVALSILSGIFIIILFIFLFKKMKKSGGLGGILGGFIGFASVIFFLFVQKHVYIITKGNQYAHNVVLGTKNYTMNNGKVINIDNLNTNGLVVNDSNAILAIEEVVYGAVYYPDIIEIGAMSMYEVSQVTIDYLFEDAPPEEISKETTAETVTRLWLRAAESE